LEDRQPGQEQKVALLGAGGPLFDQRPESQDGVEDARLEHLRGDPQGRRRPRLRTGDRRPEPVPKGGGGHDVAVP
jgi:hypothetical protein